MFDGEGVVCEGSYIVDSAFPGVACVDSSPDDRQHAWCPARRSMLVFIICWRMRRPWWFDWRTLGSEQTVLCLQGGLCAAAVGYNFV